MKSHLFYFQWLMICFVWCLIPMLAVGAPTQKPIDGIAATVNDRVITLSELRTAINEQGAKNSDYRQVLDGMIEQELVEREIQVRGLNASTAEIDEAIAQVRRQNYLTTNEQLIQKLKEQGVSFNNFRKNIKNQIERSKFVGAVMGNRVNVTDEDIELYYKENYKGAGRRMYTYRVRSIYIQGDKKKEKARDKALRRIEEIRTSIARKKQGFIAAAKKESDGPTAKNGGLLGTFTLKELQPTFRKAISPLNINEVSDVVPTPGGFYIFTYDKKTLAKAEGLGEVRNEIQRKLTEQEVERAFRNWVRETKNSSSHIEIKIQSANEL